VKVTRPIWGALLAGLAACGGAGAPVAPVPGTAVQVPEGPVAVRVAPRGETEAVEVGGIAPNDTVIALRRGQGRTVILRHGPPDRTEFVEVFLPSTVFARAPRDTVQVTIRARPGVYGIDLSADADWGPGTEIAFKYAVHFYPPADALRQYRTLTEVERRLTVARRERNGDLTIYLSVHPATDVLRAFIPGEGTYVMVVGK
jgi:acetamidase/formamidase